MLMASKQAVPVSLCEVLRQIFCHHDRRSLDRDYQNRYSALAAFYTMIHAPASTTIEEIFILSIASTFLDLRSQIICFRGQRVGNSHRFA
jgi:hypothetical protein